MIDSYSIRCKALSRRFGETVALEALDLNVVPGEIFGLVGPDGAGKTTTMRLLTGILAPSSGEAWVDGLHIVHQAEPLKERIGYMSQRFGLYPDLSVLENINFYADLYGVPRRGREAKLDRLLGFSHLTPFKRRRAGNLSGGMKQKLGLACALIHTPQILFLDEPTNGVDPVSRRDFWRILYQLLKEKVTIFVSTAYLDEAERCNRIALLHQGKLLACDTVAGVKGLLKGSLLEVRCAQPRQAARLFREAGLSSTALFGDRIHILDVEPERIRGIVEGILRREAFELYGIEYAEPSLEDVFASALPEKT